MAARLLALEDMPLRSDSSLFRKKCFTQPLTFCDWMPQTSEATIFEASQGSSPWLREGEGRGIGGGDAGKK